MTITIKPCNSINGTVEVPGDKSISHRLAMLCALASGESTIENFLCSEDCLDTLHAVEKLGAKVERNNKQIKITGTGGKFTPTTEPLDMGNSGTGMRLLCGLLAGQGFSATLIGDDSLSSRPMKRISSPLELMGADIELTGERGSAPIKITGDTLHGISYTLPMASAQVKSAILLAGLFAEGETEVIEPKETRDHTEQLFRAMGIPINIDGLSISITGYAGESIPLKSGNWQVPGDFSSAAFWITAAACRDGAEVTIINVGLNQRRTALIDVLQRMGADIQCKPHSISNNWEPIGDIIVKGNKLTGTVVSGNEIPNLIDELPLVAVAGALATGKTIISDAAELRVKETDRIATVAINLKKLGVTVEEKPDGMIVTGPNKINGNVTLDSFGDHRIAMAMAILAQHADTPIQIDNTDCIATSYPGFEEDLITLTR
ncbi:MAG: 3-phosphoshikimate 1-carboxyvinyltransferase [Kiritimatiellae bacterium]|nr:3-phosphoshikimate 1-carboxyvinyltransferase [Kiritimatiellia bacterium]